MGKGLNENIKQLRILIAESEGLSKDCFHSQVTIERMLRFLASPYICFKYDVDIGLLSGSLQGMKISFRGIKRRGDMGGFIVSLEKPLEEQAEAVNMILELDKRAEKYIKIKSGKPVKTVADNGGSYHHQNCECNDCVFDLEHRQEPANDLHDLPF